MAPADDHPLSPFVEAPVDPFPDAGPRWEPASQDEEDAFIALVDEGIADTDAGRVISSEAIFAWMDSWFTDQALPPPKCGD